MECGYNKNILLCRQMASVMGKKTNSVFLLNCWSGLCYNISAEKLLNIPFHERVCDVCLQFLETYHIKKLTHDQLNRRLTSIIA